MDSFGTDKVNVIELTYNSGVWFQTLVVCFNAIEVHISAFCNIRKTFKIKSLQWCNWWRDDAIRERRIVALTHPLWRELVKYLMNLETTMMNFHILFCCPRPLRQTMESLPKIFIYTTWNMNVLSLFSFVAYAYMACCRWCVILLSQLSYI